MSPNLAVAPPAPLVLPPVSVRALDAPDYPEFLASVETHRDLWLALDRQAAVPEEFVDRARVARRVAHLVVLAEDWCGDAVNTLPWLGRLAERLPGVDLRVLPRDSNPDLMDAHRTGTSRSIPVLILYDADWNELGWWGPRPRALQEWVLEHGMAMDKDERYREVRKWYARDRGNSILEEVVSLFERVG
jgi:hypothetical protein